jgi:hypothetical protein
LTPDSKGRRGSGDVRRAEGKPEGPQRQAGDLKAAQVVFAAGVNFQPAGAPPSSFAFIGAQAQAASSEGIDALLHHVFGELRPLAPERRAAFVADVDADRNARVALVADEIDALLAHEHHDLAVLDKVTAGELETLCVRASREAEAGEKNPR